MRLKHKIKTKVVVTQVKEPITQSITRVKKPVTQVITQVTEVTYGRVEYCGCCHQWKSKHECYEHKNSQGLTNYYCVGCLRSGHVKIPNAQKYAYEIENKKGPIKGAK